jgi:phosphoribosylformimino-5-aminoimidazole carboxamide ribotide isomerase
VSTIGDLGPLPVFELLPAIDIRAGRVVRLRQGDFDREVAYEADPLAVASRFVAQGATWLHVVDLDGARDGEPRQLDAAAAVVAEVHGRARVELGGGLRTAVAVAGAIGTGAARVTVGTAALTDPAFVRSIVSRHGAERVVASIDVRDGIALGEGWRPGAVGMPAPEAIEMLADAGVVTFEVTSIARDGLMEGPDLELLRALVALQGGRIIASGGVASIEDVLAVQAIGCAGVIVGSALYEGRFDVATAIAAVGSAGRRTI